MMDTILYTRDMIGRDSKGHVVRANAKLYSLGSQAPYFAFTTGCRAWALDLIRESFEDIAHYVDLHLCGQDGAPMHCIGNAIYFAENGNKAALANHLRIDGLTAESIIGAIICCDSKEEREKYMDSIVAGLRDGWRDTAQECIDWLDLEKSEGDYMTDGALQWEDDSPAIRFDGETFNIDESHAYSNNAGLQVNWNGASYHLFADSDIAGEAAREYWEDMAHNDKSEITIMVGEAALISWALSEPYAVGSVSVNSLTEWLDLWLATPEEHWASYDGETCECLINEAMAEEFSFSWDDSGGEWQSAVMYRC